MDSSVKREFMARVRKVSALVMLLLVVTCSLAAILPAVLAQGAKGDAAQAQTKVESSSVPWIVMSAALSVLGATLGAGYAVAHVGAAALGAASEKPEIMGRAIIFVGMAEGLVVFGFAIAVMLILKI